MIRLLLEVLPLALGAAVPVVAVSILALMFGGRSFALGLHVRERHHVRVDDPRDEAHLTKRDLGGGPRGGGGAVIVIALIPALALHGLAAF